MTAAIRGHDSPDLPHLPKEASSAASVGHDRAGHTFRKIAIAAGVTAAVAFFAIAAFATLALPPLAIVTLPAMTFTAIIGGLAMAGILSSTIAIVSAVAARVFSHSPKPAAAPAPLPDDIEVLPGNYPSAADEIQKLKESRPIPVLTVTIDESKPDAPKTTVLPVYYQVERDLNRSWGVAYDGVPISYQGSGSQKVSNIIADLYHFCDSDPVLTENVGFLMTQGETAIPLGEWQASTGKAQKGDGQWLVDLQTKGDILEIHHFVPFVVIDPELAETTSEKYWIEVVISLNKNEVSQNDFHSTNKTFRVFPRTQDTSSNIDEDKRGSDYTTALVNRYKQIAVDRPLDVM